MHLLCRFSYIFLHSLLKQQTFGNEDVIYYVKRVFEKWKLRRDERTHVAKMVTAFGKRPSFWRKLRIWCLFGKARAILRTKRSDLWWWWGKSCVPASSGQKEPQPAYGVKWKNARTLCAIDKLHCRKVPVQHEKPERRRVHKWVHGKFREASSYFQVWGIFRRCTQRQSCVRS